MTKLKAAELIREIPDFPKEGIVFRDITPVFQSCDALAEVIKAITDAARAAKPNVIVGIESRGFLLGVPVAINLDASFVPVRKLGKLPSATIREEYALEYGTNTVEIHADAIVEGDSVVIIDDLLATGGTAAASARLVERLGGIVKGFVFLIELRALKGRKALADYPVKALISYP
jgi:adenine phosphoribosyltransferase